MKIKELVISGVLAVLATSAFCVEVAPIEVLRPARYCTNDSWRVYCDFKVKADLADAKELVLETYLSDTTPFSGGIVYLESGKGWYRAEFDLQEPGRWIRHAISKWRFGTEGAPAGWRKVTTVRVAYAYAANAEQTKGVKFEVRGLGSTGTNADVLVITGDSALAKGTDKAIADYAKTLTTTLDRLGVRLHQTSDLDLGDTSFKGVRLAVLPWNPSVPAEVQKRLETFVADGGKLLVCGTFSPGLVRLLGLKDNGFWTSHNAPRSESFAGFAKCGKGLVGQPDFVAQGSWQTRLLEPQGEGEVIAMWRNGDGRVSSKPAIVKTPHGFSIGHVWMGGAAGADDLMAAMVADAIPDYRAEFAAMCARLRKEAEANRRWIASLEGKPGERRLMWCHSPFGLRGRDWDGTAKLLKDGHFTDLMVNLVWAGSTSYKSDVWPARQLAAKDGDQFDLCKAACRKHGIKMHVWQVCWFLGRDVDKETVARLEKEGRLQIGKNGKLMTHFRHWLCPSHPQNRKEVVDAMIELAKKGADGVHFDYIRYPGELGCYCPRCRALFEREIGARVEHWPEDLRTPALKRRWADFRKSFITETVRTVAETVHRDYSGVEVSAAVFRNPRNGGDADGVGQDWGRWCAEGLLDFACPMDYTESAAAFRGMIRPQLELVGKAKLYPGIGISCWTRNGQRLMQFAQQVLELRKAGFDGFAVFDMNGADHETNLPFLATGLLR